MMLWAVFRAILRPAALVAEGCLRFELVGGVDIVPTVAAALSDEGVDVDAGAVFDELGGI